MKLLLEFDTDLQRAKDDISVITQQVSAGYKKTELRLEKEDIKVKVRKWRFSFHANCNVYNCVQALGFDFLDIGVDINVNHCTCTFGTWHVCLHLVSFIKTCVWNVAGI